MHTVNQKQMNASYQASLVNRHTRRFTGYNTVRINSIPGIFRRLLLKKSEKEKLNLNACGNRTLKYDATQPIIRYWLNSGSNNFVSCLTEFWNLSFSELWILQSYWILLKTEFRLNSFKILKIQAAFESPGKTVEGKPNFNDLGVTSDVTVQVKVKMFDIRAWWHRRVIFRC